MIPDWIDKIEHLAEGQRNKERAFNDENAGQIADCLEALCELVQLEKWKEKYGADITYQQRLPVAWHKAFIACKYD